MSEETKRPVLGDFRATKVVELPSHKGSRVEIYDGMLVGDQAAVMDPSANPIQQGLKMLPRLVKSLNFVAEDGSDLPVTEESMGYLKEADVLFLLEQIKLLGEESKKKDAA